ncbi:tetratricopeptide repeat (TPR)-like superfamily protein [Wolffia australiana]
MKLMGTPRLTAHALQSASGDPRWKIEGVCSMGRLISRRSREDHPDSCARSKPPQIMTRNQQYNPAKNPNFTLFQCRNRLIHSDSSRIDEEKLFISITDGLQPVGEACQRYIQTLHRSDITQRLNRLLAIAAKNDGFEHCFEIFKTLLLSNSPPDSSSYAYLGKSFQRVSDQRLILRFSQEVMEITSGREPSVINKIIFILAKVGHFLAALRTFETMKNSSKNIDSVTFNTVLAILGKQGQLERMLSEFKEMKESGLVPDYVTYNTMINSLRRFGKLDLCLVYLKEMVDSGIEPDLLTYSAVMDGLGRAGRPSDAIGVLGKMKMARVHPSVYVIRGLAGNLRKACKLEIAGSLQEEMKSSKLLGPQEIEAGKQLKKKRWRLRQAEYQNPPLTNNESLNDL